MNLGGGPRNNFKRVVGAARGCELAKDFVSSSSKSNYRSKVLSLKVQPQCCFKLGQGQTPPVMRAVTHLGRHPRLSEKLAFVFVWILIAQLDPLLKCAPREPIQ